MKNQLMITLLRSPLHTLASGHTMLLTFKDRSTGTEQTQPVPYTRTGQTVTCFTKLNSDWWQNVKSNPDVRVRIKNQEVTGTAKVVTPEDDRELIVDRLTSVNHRITYSDAVEQAPTLVLIQISLAPEAAPGDMKKLAT